MLEDWEKDWVEPTIFTWEDDSETLIKDDGC